MKPHRAKKEPGKKEAARAFKLAVCGSLDSPLEAHHAVPAQVLKRIAKSKGLTGPAYWAVVYDHTIGVPLEHRTHERHTNRVAVIPGEQIPPRVWERAIVIGPEAVAALEREHPFSEHGEVS